MRTCKISLCDKQAKRNSSMCSMHRSRQERYGSPNVVRPKGFQPGYRPPLAAEVGYYGLHDRLWRYRGRAKDHLCECGQPAAEWSYDHSCPNEIESEKGPYSMDLDRYQPRCKPCHTNFDRSRLVAS